jgi:hypothetical protein
MILTYRRPDPPDTHVLTMVNNVIEVLNYVIAAHPPPLNYVIADNDNGSNCKWLTFFINGGSLKRQVGSPVTRAGGWRLLRR